MMNDQHPCEEWAEKLAARHQEDLTPQERLDLQKHLDECPVCAAQYQAYQSLEARIRELPVPEPSPSLLPILRGLREREKGQLVPSFAERIEKISSFQKGRRLALVVGVSSFARADIPPLHDAERDAQELAAVLQQQAGVELIALLGKEATERNILSSLAHLAEESRETDEVILSFAGHGYSSETQPQGLDLTFCLYDWDRQSGAGALSIEQVRAITSQLKARRVLLILDACEAGGIDLKSHFPSLRGQKRLAEYFARSEHDESLALVASTGSQEQLAGSDESESLPTLLRRVLLDKEKAVADDHPSEEVADLQQFYRYLEAAIT